MSGSVLSLITFDASLPMKTANCFVYTRTGLKKKKNRAFSYEMMSTVASPGAGWLREDVFFYLPRLARQLPPLLPIKRLGIRLRRPYNSNPRDGNKNNGAKREKFSVTSESYITLSRGTQSHEHSYILMKGNASISRVVSAEFTGGV